MVERAEFEQLLISKIAKAVGEAQDIAKENWGLQFAVNIHWELTKGYFDDEKTTDKGGVAI